MFLPLASYLPCDGQNLKDVGRGAGGGLLSKAEFEKDPHGPILHKIKIV